MLAEILNFQGANPILGMGSLSHLNDNCKIMMDINIELVSASYVSTKLKCRGEFIKSNTDNLENNFELSGKDSMCFWGGNIIYSEKDVTVRMKS